MGKSAFTMVAAMQTVVQPHCHKPTCIKQPPYFRSKRTIATSSHLLSYRSCIASALAGKKPGTQAAVRTAFTAAAHGCKGK